MEYDKNPLTPHLQIYKWQISSLLSITHRITGVINAIAISLICIWFLFTINNEKILFENILNSFFGKFISISLCWTFSFHILNEIRHLIWDAGYGFDPKNFENHWLRNFNFIFFTCNYYLFFGSEIFNYE